MRSIRLRLLVATSATAVGALLVLFVVLNAWPNPDPFAIPDQASGSLRLSAGGSQAGTGMFSYYASNDWTQQLIIRVSGFAGDLERIVEISDRDSATGESELRSVLDEAALSPPPAVLTVGEAVALIHEIEFRYDGESTINGQTVRVYRGEGSGGLSVIVHSIERVVVYLTVTDPTGGGIELTFDSPNG